MTSVGFANNKSLIRMSSTKQPMAEHGMASAIADRWTCILLRPLVPGRRQPPAPTMCSRCRRRPPLTPRWCSPPSPLPRGRLHLPTHSSPPPTTSALHPDVHTPSRVDVGEGVVVGEVVKVQMPITILEVVQVLWVEAELLHLYH